MTANELSKRFLKWFQENNPESRIFRNNAGCFKTEAGQWVRYGIPNAGGSDFIAFVPFVPVVKETCHGKCTHSFLTVQFYEIKTLKDKMSAAQIKFADLICKMGGEYFIVKNNKDDELLFSIEKWSPK